MVYSYKECLEVFGNDYQLGIAVKEETIYRVEPGIYANEENISEFEVIVKKYPNAIFAGEYAYYYHNLTDVIPEKY